MMDDEITIEGVSALLIQLAAVQMERDEERARADELAGDLSELRENVLLGLGMTAEAVASMDADGMESSITDLLAGHGELVAERDNAKIDADSYRKSVEDLTAEVERLRAETAAYRSDWRAREALSRLNIEYDGSDPLERLAEEIAALRAQMLLDSDQGYELARLSALTGISLHSTNPHEMTEEFAAAVAELREQLVAEVDAIRFAAHMPHDYEHGLASWINQYLYAAYVGARMGPEVIDRIEAGHLIFPNAPIYQERNALAAEVADLSERHKTLTEKFASLMIEVNDEYTRRVAAEAEGERLEAERNELQTLLNGAEAERDEWMETAETTEGELCRFMEDLIAVVGDQVIVGDEVQFAAIVAAVATLRAQLAAREHAACPHCGQSLHGEQLLPF